MLRLYQREGCPHCQAVREELTRQNLSFEAVAVAKLPVDRPDLSAHEGVTSREIPILRDGERWIQGSEEILAHLAARAEADRFGDPSFALTRRLEGRSVEEVLGRVRGMLEAAGFTVRYELDPEAGRDERYVVLGIEAGELTQALLALEPAAALLLPLSVAVVESGSAVVVSAIDPVALFGVAQRREALLELARETRGRLGKGLASL